MTDEAAGEAARPERFLLFALGEGRFAVEGRLVRGVVPVASVTPLPRAPAAWRGVFHHMGNVVPLLDASGVLGVGAATGQTPVLTLLVEVSPWSVGIAIDEVKAYEKLSFAPAPAEPSGRTGVGAFTKGTLERDGERFTVLDTGALLGALRAA